VIGGMSAEFTLKTVKLATCRYLDRLPTTGNETGRAFRDPAMEEKILQLTRATGIGAQFGGKYFAHDVRVIRLPRHGASCPVGIGVSCSADRQAKAKITEQGVFLEQLEENPARFLPDVTPQELAGQVVRVDLHRPMREILAELSKHPVATRLSLSGPLIVARDIAHAKLKEKLDAGGDLPAYFKDHMIYYAGPAGRPGATRRARWTDHRGRMVSSIAEPGRQHGDAREGQPLDGTRDACKRRGSFWAQSADRRRAWRALLRKVEVQVPGLNGAIWRIGSGLPASSSPTTGTTSTPACFAGGDADTRIG
jgi:fumarate hydratase class I